jgi:hypothetical protein
VIDDRGDSIHDHLARTIDISIRSRPIHQHQKVSTQRHCFVDRPQVVLDPLTPHVRSCSRKHASATQARHTKASVANQASRCRWIVTDSVTPRPDPLDAMLYTRIHDLAQRSLASRHLVETKTRKRNH